MFVSNNFFLKILCLLTVFSTSACASMNKNIKPPKVVENIDLNKYVGEWYEIATIPRFFQWGCGGAKATYKIISENKISVLNQCMGFFSIRDISGVATVVDSKEPAKLMVDFGYGRKGEYWVVMLADDYSYAVVSNSKRSSLWVLYRKPLMPDDLYNEILEKLKNRDFNLEDLKKTKTPFKNK